MITDLNIPPVCHPCSMHACCLFKTPTTQSKAIFKNFKATNNNTMNGAGDELSAIFDACTWPVSAVNKSEPMWATGKLIQDSPPASSASSLHDVMQIKTFHQNPQPVMVNRNGSDQLALEKLAQELSVSNLSSTPSLLPPLTTLSLNEIVEISHQRFDQNPLVSGMARSESELALEKLLEEMSNTATSVVPPMSASSIVDNENIIEIENPQASAPYIYSVLKAKLNMACAAAAIRFGVWYLFSLFGPTKLLSSTRMVLLYYL